MRISDWSSDVCSSDLGTRDFDDIHAGQQATEIGIEIFLIGKCLFMRKEDIFISACHDIIMKCPCGNGFSRLPYKECSCRIKTVEPCQGLSGLGILARRERAAALAMHQTLHARFAMAVAKSALDRAPFLPNSYPTRPPAT